jgi:hypothetical protein
MNFDLAIEVRGHHLRVIGNATQYRPAKGPTMEHAGGEPEEPSEIEIESAYLIRLPHQTRRVRKYHERMISVHGLDIDDVIGEEIARIKREGGFNER